MPHDWKAELAGLHFSRNTPDPPSLKEVLTRACGPAIRIRDARRRLFLISTSVLEGRPNLIEIDERALIMISLDDLSDILKMADLQSLLRDIGRHGKRPRRLISNR